MVFFTCFVQGSTIKSFVSLLDIKLQDKESNISSHIQNSLMDNIMAGIEVLAGRSGHYMFGMRFHKFEKTFINKYLLVPNSTENDSLENFINQHFTNLYAPTIIAKVTPVVLTQPKVYFQETIEDVERPDANLSIKTMQTKWNKSVLVLDLQVAPGEDTLLTKMKEKQDRTKHMEKKLIPPFVSLAPSISITEDIKLRYNKVSENKKGR